MTPAVQEQLSRLWLEHYPAVVDAQQRKPGMDATSAEDVAQQAFVQLGKYLERGAVLDRQPVAFLHTLANRARVDTYRAEHPVLETCEDGTEVRAQFLSWDADRDTVDRDSVTGTVEELQYRPCLDFEFAPTFDRALRALPSDERDAFVLTTLRGLTLREAAGVLGVAFKTVDRKAASATTYIGKELAA